MIFHSFSKNESVILKMDSCTSQKNKRNTHMLYDCRDIGGFLVFFNRSQYFLFHYGFSTMSPLLKAFFKFCTNNYLYIPGEPE